MTVGVLDYGAGNLHSLTKAIERCGARTVVSEDWDIVLGCDALVLPGVGAFGAAVASLPSDLTVIRGLLDEGLPCLGICLGMQLLFDSSAEANGPGLGVIAGTVNRLQAATVPHIGWNDVEPVDSLEDPVIGPATDGLVAYFANSFVCDPVDETVVVAWSHVEGCAFPAAVRKGKTWGVQFHPEKSSQPGLAVIDRFLAEVRI
jgi:glutamine amidotransferase